MRRRLITDVLLLGVALLVCWPAAARLEARSGSQPIDVAIALDVSGTTRGLTETTAKASPLYSSPFDLVSRFETADSDLWQTEEGELPKRLRRLTPDDRHLPRAMIPPSRRSD